jgi:predicted DNA-binding ribbon-helix-helix protein
MGSGSPIIKRSIYLDGHKTSVSLEDSFWRALKDIARSQDLTIAEVVGDIDTRRQGNLSSAIRLFVLDTIRTQVSRPFEDHVGASAAPEGKVAAESIFRRLS